MTRIAFLSIAIGLLIFTDLSARRTAVGADDETLRLPTDLLVQPYLDNDIVVGMTIGVLREGKQEVFGYGRMSPDDSRVPDGDTLYEIGSVTKVLTGTLLADAVVQGQVKLDQPAGDLLPAGVKMPEGGDRAITLQDLSTHVSGLPRLPDNMKLGDPNNPYADYLKEDLYAFLNHHELAREPGTGYKYSNVAQGLLGHLLSLRAKSTYEDLLRSRIAVPLKMSSTTITIDKQSQSRLAPGHTAGGQPAANWDLSVLAGAGGVRSTVNDLLLFAAANLAPPNGKLGEAIEMAWTVHQKPINEGDASLGLGWHVTPDGTHWHNGQTGGYHSMIRIDRKTKSGVILLTNTAAGEVDQLATDILRMISGEKVAPRKPEKASDMLAKLLQEHQGQRAAAAKQKSPFAAVRWRESQPQVKVGDEWFKLVSLDGLPASDIVAFCRRTYHGKWQMRFEEDLVDVLTGMGHEPKDTVQLVVMPLESSTTRTLEDVPMTRANRQAIKAAADGGVMKALKARVGQRSEQEQPKRSAVPIDDAKLFRARIDQFLSAARTKAGFSGAVLVARGGQPVYQGAFGVSHLKSKAPNTLDTPFRIASLSKQFTAAAIFRLQSQGKLSIDDPVHRYLSEFAELPYRSITIHHLLTHTSGLPRSPESILGSLRWSAMSQAATPVDDYVRLAVETPLKFEPGKDYQYSNFGYRVLAALIARVSGRDYADFMEQEVFRPLGMKDTGVARVTRPPSEGHIAEGLSFLRLDRAREPLFVNGEDGRNFGAGYGSGGIYSSANDLLRWDRVLAGDEFLTKSQKTRLFRPVHGNYACGWVVKTSGLDGRLYQMHSGANEGFFSQMMRIPEDDLVIIAVGNVQATPAIDEVLEQLFRLCRSLPYQDL